MIASYVLSLINIFLCLTGLLSMGTLCLIWCFARLLARMRDSRWFAHYSRTNTDVPLICR